MKKMNKKGFTIVELVIVIAVIAILAAVLIPTFSGIIRKAKISNDTNLAKNWNTMLSAAGAIDSVDNFGEVLEAARDADFKIADLNPTADGCYLVWESSTNQMLLVDGKANYKVLFAANVLYETMGDTWYFAIGNKADADKVRADLADKNVNVIDMAGSVDALNAILGAGGEQTVYMDDSLVLDSENILVLDKADSVVTVVLGDSQLNTDGILENIIPIQVNQGTLNLDGGIVGAAGSYVDADGRVVNTPIQSLPGTVVNINGTTFNTTVDGYTLFAGDANIENAVFNAKNIGIYVNGSAKVVLENTTIVSDGRCVWSCNLTDTGHDGTALLTIKSGSYTGGSANWNPITACGGDIVVEGGNFVGNTNGIFSFNGYVANCEITVKGGTFTVGENTYNYSELTTDILKSLTTLKNISGYEISVTGNTSAGFVITVVKTVNN